MATTTSRVRDIPATACVFVVTIKRVYGRDLYYPSNEAAHQFTLIAGKVTLGRVDIRTIKALGHPVRYLSDAVLP